MISKSMAGKNKKSIKPFIKAAILISVSAIMIFSVYAALFLRNLSRIIGDKGLLLEYTDTMAYPVSGNLSGKALLWFEPDKAREISVTSNDGLCLSALIYRQDDRPGGKWAVLVHGYSAGKESMQEYAREYYDKGYNVLLPDLRAHGESQGSFVGMGWLDRIDLLDWIDLIIEEDPKAIIVLHGISMGASAVMMASGEERLPENVAAIIADSGYTSVWDILEYQLEKRYDIPSFPIMFGGNLWSVSQLGFSWKDASAVKMVRASRTPTLFIHGNKDEIVPVKMVFELYSEAKCIKRLLIIEEAGHAMSAEEDPERYWGEVFGFLNHRLEA